MNIKPLVIPLIVIALVVGVGLYLIQPQAEVFGATLGESVSTARIGDLQQTHVGQRVAIEGTIAQECPHSGCWAVIEDSSGQIRIDTQAGGFALPLRREGSKVRVVGKVMQTESGSLEISAESAEL